MDGCQWNQADGETLFLHKSKLHSGRICFTISVNYFFIKLIQLNKFTSIFFKNHLTVDRLELTSDRNPRQGKPADLSILQSQKTSTM